jgi:enoyl-CoA hydratase
VVDGPSLDGAKELARRIVENGPLAIVKSKQVVRNSFHWSDEEMWDKQNEILGNLYMTNDAREGSLAFAEKRKPNWTGT